jgi:hypothetical protein
LPEPVRPRPEVRCRGLAVENLREHAAGVGGGEDTGQSPVTGDHGGADVPRGHGRENLPQRCSHVDDVTVVDVGILHGQLFWIRRPQLRAEQELDVAIGDDALKLVVFRDRKMVDAVLQHELAGLSDRGGEFHGVGKRRHGRFELWLLHLSAHLAA